MKPSMSMQKFDWTTGKNDRLLVADWISQYHGTSTSITMNNNSTAVTCSGSAATFYSWNDAVPVMTGAQMTGSFTKKVIPQRALSMPMTTAPLGFSPTINATDLVIEFLHEARRRIPGLTREGFLRLPIADFFAFLLRRAAREEGRPPPECDLVPCRSPRPRCLGCGRFITRAWELARIAHCNARCLERAAERAGLVLAAH